MSLAHVFIADPRDPTGERSMLMRVKGPGIDQRVVLLPGDTMQLHDAAGTAWTFECDAPHSLTVTLPPSTQPQPPLVVVQYIGPRAIALRGLDKQDKEE